MTSGGEAKWPHKVVDLCSDCGVFTTLYLGVCQDCWEEKNE